MSQFIEMFGNPVTNTKGWKTAKIKDVAPEMPSKEQLSGKIWLLNLDMIESNTGRIIEKVYEDVENALSVQSFDEGNVLFSKLRPYLNKVVIPDEPGMATTELVPLRPEPSKLHKVFLSHLLRGNQFVNYANDIAGGTKMPRMPLTELRNFDCILPPMDKQLEFVFIAEQVDKYNVSVRQPYTDEYTLHDGHDLFFVFYVNTNDFQPLLAQDYIMRKKVARGTTVAWYGTVGNIVNLRTVQVGYDAAAGRALLDLGTDMTYVLSQSTKYIRPLQEHGRKVCISIEGGGKGLGFCNLTDAQIEDFAAQVKTVIEQYELDGVNLWDRNSGYGKEGMPAVNTTSYPKLIKALREALGTEKLLTVTVYEEPTATFWDTEATGGIAVGDYIDYAWSGYNSNSEAPQLLDPWHPELEYVSTYTQKPIANLPKDRYGCINFPIYPAAQTEEEAMMREPRFLLDWTPNYKPNNIIVFDDLHSNLQDSYEAFWDNTFAACCTFMDPENSYLLGSKKGYTYLLDMNRLWTLSEGIQNYGKWLKDWN